MQDSKRVIVLEHIKSDNIEQAIIILKENTKSKYSSIVKEAEYIINSYAFSLDNVGKQPIKAKKDNFIIIWLLAAACLGFVGLIATIMQLIS